MEEMVLREGKVPLVVGLIDCMVMAPMLGLSVWDGLRRGDRVQLVFCTAVFGGFLLMGAFLLLSYFRRRLWLGPQGLRYRPTVGRERSCAWAQVARMECSRTGQYRLYGEYGPRLASFEWNMPGAIQAADYIARQGVEVHRPAAPPGDENWIRARWSPQRIRRERRWLRAAGWVLGLSAAAAWLLLPLQGMLAVCLAVLWVVWGLYLAMYPRLRVDLPHPGSGADSCYDELPWVGASLALLILLAGGSSINLSGGALFGFAAVYGAVLYLPFLAVLALRRRRESPAKLLMVAAAVLLMAFAGTPAVNLLATTELPRHQSARVAEMNDRRGGRGSRHYYLELDTADGRVELEVSGGFYRDIDPGSTVWICTRRSVFGIEYRLVHR